MSLKNQIFLRFNSSLLREIDDYCKNPQEAQQKVFDHLIKCGRQTYFGREYNFDNISSYEDFCKKVPINDYDSLECFLHRALHGEERVLWPEKTSFFAKDVDNSGKVRYLPVTPHNLKHGFFKGIRTLIALYLSKFPESKLFGGHTLAFGGNIEIDKRTRISTGDISAILIKNAPWISNFFRTPSKHVAIMPEGLSKEDRICRESSDRNISAIVGSPERDIAVMDMVLEFSNRASIAKVWPNLELFIYNGSIDPWRNRLNSLINTNKTLLYSTFTTPAGILAVQDSPTEGAMRLCLASGIFYEFIPLEDLAKARSNRDYLPHTVADVQMGIKYAVAVTTSAGLWRYLLDDIVEITSKEPLKVQIVRNIEADTPATVTPNNTLIDLPITEQPEKKMTEKIQQPRRTFTYVNLFGEVEPEPMDNVTPKISKKVTGEESAGLFDTADAIVETLLGTTIATLDREDTPVLFDTNPEKADNNTASKQSSPTKGDFVGELF